MTLTELAFMGFIIGLTGALAPGPTLIATIQSAFHTGWSGGPRVTLGHMIAEAGLILVIIAGFSSLSESIHRYVALVGGLALIMFGGMTLFGSKKMPLSEHEKESKRVNPIFAGFLTSISNPYFWIWWFSVGTALLFSSLSNGFAGIIAFIAGHWSADLLWFTLVSVSIHKSKKMFTARLYQIILTGCGFLLIIFGIWFIVQAAYIR